MPYRTSSNTLVLGGTGKTGRRIVERLRALVVPTRVGSRSGDPAFDWEQPSTWGQVLDGVDAVYVSYYPDVAVPGAVDVVRSFTETAVDAGVSRLVLISGRGEPQAERVEQIVRDAGASWTIVRCAWFNQNFSESYLLEPILAGDVVVPAGDVPEPFVDAEDIADVAVAALTDDRHDGALYELTGSRLLTFAEAVAEIAGATGRDIRYVPISVEEYASMLARHQVPPEYVSLLTYLFDEVMDGRNAHPADGVQRALGRKPRDFRDYARATATTGVWSRVPAGRVA